MAKFLQSRAGQTPISELEKANHLTVSGLRSLIAGNFHLLQVQSRPGTPLEGISDCFILLHEKSLFVLMQCHKSGIIHGDALEPQWTCFNYLGDGVAFENPLAQNRRNIACLAAMLKLPVDCFHSCILFDNECELRRIPGNTANHSIIWADQVEPHFAQLLPQLPALYSHTQLDALRDIFLLLANEC